MAFDPMTGRPPQHPVGPGTQRVLRTSQRLTMLFLWFAFGLFALVVVLVGIAVLH